MGSKKGVQRGPYKTKNEIQLTKELVCQTLREQHGSIFHSSMALGVQRGRLLNFVERYKECAAAYKEAHDTLGDLAERKLHELIMAGDVRCILWYLATKHAQRGYGKADVGPDELPFDRRQPMHVSTVNIISIPNGQYLTREQARAMTIDMVPAGSVISNGHANGNRSDAADAVVANPPEQSSILD